jgi:hypothetical protein
VSNVNRHIKWDLLIAPLRQQVAFIEISANSDNDIPADKLSAPSRQPAQYHGTYILEKPV